jgi:hypothetical protein
MFTQFESQNLKGTYHLKGWLKWEANIKVDLKDIWRGLDSFCLGYGPVVGPYEHSNASLSFYSIVLEYRTMGKV